MGNEEVGQASRIAARTATASVETKPPAAEWALPQDASAGRHRIFLAEWYFVNALLLVGIIAAVYTSAREYSTRRYLKGFSDAVIPGMASPEQKIQSILTWMSSPAAQMTPAYVGEMSDRDPVDTLNFQALLQVCGTATNAFLNLADSNGLSTRRLLLLDSSGRTKHVDAEALVKGRWVVVDPAFRTILRDPEGNTLTRDQLASPATFAAATKNISKYDPTYSFERTAHVRLSRLGFLGRPAEKTLNFVLPGWQDSSGMSLLMERESLAAMAAAITFVLLLNLARLSLRWYGENRLRVHPVHIRHQLRRAFQAFFTTAN